MEKLPSFRGVKQREISPEAAAPRGFVKRLKIEISISKSQCQKY